MAQKQSLDFDIFSYQQVRFSGSPKVTKKRLRKLSDDEAFDLVDVGNVPKAPPQDQCVETEVSVFKILLWIFLITDFLGTTWWYFGLVISQIQYSGSRIKTGQQYSDRNPFLRTETNEDTCQNGLIINRNASFCAWGQRRGKVWHFHFIFFGICQWILIII